MKLFEASVFIIFCFGIAAFWMVNGAPIVSTTQTTTATTTESQEDIEADAIYEKHRNCSTDCLLQLDAVINGRNFTVFQNKTIQLDPSLMLLNHQVGGGKGATLFLYHCLSIKCFKPTVGLVQVLKTPEDVFYANRFTLIGMFNDHTELGLYELMANDTRLTSEGGNRLFARILSAMKLEAKAREAMVAANISAHTRTDFDNYLECFEDMKIEVQDGLYNDLLFDANATSILLVDLLARCNRVQLCFEGAATNLSIVDYDLSGCLVESMVMTLPQLMGVTNDDDESETTSTTSNSNDNDDLKNRKRGLANSPSTPSFTEIWLLAIAVGCALGCAALFAACSLRQGSRAEDRRHLIEMKEL